MSTNKPYLYSIAFLSLTIPVPGRFVFGVTLAFELILLETVGVLISLLVKKLKFEEIRTYFVMTGLIATTLLFRQLLAVTYSEIALTLGFIIFFPTVSVIIIYSLFNIPEENTSETIKDDLIKTINFSLLLVIFSLIRDVACFGTFSFFGPNHMIYEKILLNPEKTGIFMFFASIPGALILVGVLIYIFIFVKNKMMICAEREKYLEKQKQLQKEDGNKSDTNTEVKK